MTERAPLDDVWAGERVARWLGQSARLERQFEVVSDRLFDAAGLGRGEAVLDVGCGTGPTTRRAAIAVGRAGRVTGLDISEEMLAVARNGAVGAAGGRSAGAGGGGSGGAGGGGSGGAGGGGSGGAVAAGDAAVGDVAPIEWVVSDAVTWVPPGPAHDIVISRFGVMFFSDPVAAFAVLARAVHPGGRLAMVVWARRDESELFEIPLQAAVDTLRRCGADPIDPPVGAGPFSLHDPGETSALLESAGWSDVHVESVDLVLPFMGGVPVGEAAGLALDFGPTRLVLADVDEAHSAAVRDDLARVFAGHLDAAGHVILRCRVRVVTARRG